MHMSPCIKIVYLKIISGHHVCTFSKVSLLYDLSEGRLFDKIENSGKVIETIDGRLPQFEAMFQCPSLYEVFTIPFPEFTIGSSAYLAITSQQTWDEFSQINIKQVISFAIAMLCHLTLRVPMSTIFADFKNYEGYWKLL